MPSALFLIGVATAVFVGVNIGGSSTGVAFGPATGSGVLSKRLASGLMAVFVLLGGITVGRNVVEVEDDVATEVEQNEDEVVAEVEEQVGSDLEGLEEPSDQ